MFGWLKRRSKNAKEYGKEVVGYQEIKSSFSEIKKMANQALNPVNQAEGRVETFEDAVARLKVQKADLEQNYKNYSINFYITFSFSVLCVIFSAYFFILESMILPGITCLAVMAYCLALSLRFSVWAYQIKTQKLCSVREWFLGYDWFPTFNINIPTLKQKGQLLLEEKAKKNKKLK